MAGSAAEQRNASSLAAQAGEAAGQAAPDAEPRAARGTARGTPPDPISGTDSSRIGTSSDPQPTQQSSQGARGASAASEPFDLLVIGGGINGGGIARDAAMRGLSVCLVERDDWCSGTSARSSMLAHGGLRYLEQFELGLVHEALQDREIMLEQAPHLVRPLRFLYPLYPHIASRRTVRVGLWLYDLLSHGKSVPKREFLDRDATLALVPGLEPRDLHGAASYFDGQFQSVERFVVELVWSARRHGADCRNHTEVLHLELEDDPARPGRRRCIGATLRDPEGKQATLRARATINAAGPWVDDLLGPLGPARPPLIRKTKGAHLVVPRFTEEALIVKAASDGRTFFILPWQEHCLLGTTDTDFPGEPRAAAADAADREYLLAEARRYFPDAPLDDIRYTYAGVRSLVNQEGLTESHVTRRHVLHNHEKHDGTRGLWSIQGGKLTTYRSLAEAAVDAVCKTLGHDRLAKLHPTREGTLPGGPLVPWDDFRPAAVQAAQDDFGIPAASAANLVDTYGARWRAVVEVADGGEGHGRAAGLRRIDDARPDLWCQVTYAVQEEDARTVGDVMLRRTRLGLAADGNPRVAKRVAARMAELLGWSKVTVRQELQRYEEEVRLLAVPPGEPSRLPSGS